MPLHNYLLYSALQNISSDKEKPCDLEKLLFMLGNTQRNILIGKEVVIHTKDGYHYGELIGEDKGIFYLKDYYFNSRLINTFDYSRRRFGSASKAMVPKDKIISVSEIPLSVPAEEHASRSSSRNEYHVD